MGTRVSTVVAYSCFTSKSPDYVLSKAGLFSTKLSLTINESTLHKVAIFSSFSRNREMVSAHACWGIRDCAL